jgi:hypothetical protein
MRGGGTRGFPSRTGLLDRRRADRTGRSVQQLEVVTPQDSSECDARSLIGGMPEWLMGTGCKPVGLAYAGSNPASPTIDATRGRKTTADRTDRMQDLAEPGRTRITKEKEDDSGERTPGHARV